MTKKILIAIFAAAMMISVPFESMASSFKEAITEIQGDRAIDISINQSTLTINGAQGMVLEIVSVTGRHVMTMKIESQSLCIDLRVPKGCYLVKVGSVVRKISVR